MMIKEKGVVATSLIIASLSMTLSGCGSNKEAAVNIDSSAEKVEVNDYMSVYNAAMDYYKYDGSKPRTIVTTDGEVDDYDSLHHMLLYANDLDIAGLVYSASQFHFQGDGEHTLSEINPEFQCKAEDAGSLKSYRPQEMGWIEDTIEEYAADYVYLVQNDPEYPSPEELSAVVKVGNVEFEGDTRTDTEGSDLIKACILDDDTRPLYIQSWGGFNTVARALLSIYEEYKDTQEWDSIYKKVCEKCVIIGHAQDTTWKNKIADLYPDLLSFGGSLNMGYFLPYKAVEDARPYFKNTWLTENIKFDHGELMSSYRLLGDGTHYEGELDEYQFGELLKIQWGNTEQDYDFERYDWIGEGDSTEWMILLSSVGLRGLENPNLGSWGGRITVNGTAMNRAGSYNEVYKGQGEAGMHSGDRWLIDFMEDWAARADWTVGTFEECNHAPEVTAEKLDISAKAGEVIDLKATVTDPDGDNVSTTWWIYKEASEYYGNEGLTVSDEASLETSFTVPADAESGDYFNIVLTAKDEADAPMTRYAQIIVTIE